MHAFAADPERGVFILAFLAIVVGGSLMLFALRAPTVSKAGQFSFFSREMFLLFNNILLVVATLTVLVGTLFPLIADYLELGKYSVGPPYFNKLFVPLTLALMFCLGIGASLQWKQTRLVSIKALLLKMLPVTIVVAAFLMILYISDWSVQAIVAMFLAAWVLASCLLELLAKLRHATSLRSGLQRLTLSFYGMQLGHIGLAVTAIGIAIVSHYGIEKDVKMLAGDSLQIHQYQFVFHGTEKVAGPNYVAEQGKISVFEQQQQIARLLPEKRYYHSQMSNVMTEADINANLSRDLFVALGEPLSDGAWAVRIQYKPLIRWIWLGAILMVLGSIFAIADKRYRKLV